MINLVFFREINYGDDGMNEIKIKISKRQRAGEQAGPIAGNMTSYHAERRKIWMVPSYDVIDALMI